MPLPLWSSEPEYDYYEYICSCVRAGNTFSSHVQDENACQVTQPYIFTERE